MCGIGPISPYDFGKLAYPPWYDLDEEDEEDEEWGDEDDT